MMKTLLRRVAVVLALAVSTSSLLATVKLHGIFTDNMVLQREMAIPVYGTADDGEVVTVELNGEKATATAASGHWKVKLPAMKAGGPYTMTVTGKNTLTIKGILIGDVWLCTGQSNMASTLKSYKGDPYKDYQDLFKDVPQANAMIRLFKLKSDGADTPQEDVVMDKEFGPVWRECDEQSALQFSATGYFFGSRLQRELGVPLGLIYATMGGTEAECWMSADVLRSRPEFKDVLEAYETAKKNYPQALEQYQKRMAEWKAMNRLVRKVKRAPQEPMGPNHPKRPSGLYNFVIAPLQQFAIKGAIWYQGEGNARRAVQYRTLFPELINSWRRQWGQGDFPFLFVQLAAFGQANPLPEDPDWAWLREAQAMTLALPSTGMAVAIDGGLQENIHPPYKQSVGERLAASALKVAYGRDVVASGPAYKSLRVEGNQAIVEFDHVGGGLVTRDVNLDGHRVPASALKGFAVCGEDKKFKWANAVIRGQTVAVSSPEVPKPVAVRYAWANFPVCNLYNREGFPAEPFRTDRIDKADAEKVGGIAIGKPFVCNQPIRNGLFGGLTDGDLHDNGKNAFATSGAMIFPKEVTVNLQGRYTVSDIRVYNSALGGTKTVKVQVSSDGNEFKTVGQTEFKNYSADVFELSGLSAKGVSQVRLVFPDVHEPSFQHKTNGFIFLRELEVQGTPEQ